MAVGRSVDPPAAVVDRPLDGKLELGLRILGIGKDAQVLRRAAGIAPDFQVGRHPGRRQAGVDRVVAQPLDQHVDVRTMAGVGGRPGLAGRVDQQRFVGVDHDRRAGAGFIPAQAEHLAVCRPVDEGVAGLVEGDEAAATADVAGEGRLDRRRPTRFAAEAVAVSGEHHVVGGKVRRPGGPAGVRRRAGSDRHIEVQAAVAGQDRRQDVLAVLPIVVAGPLDQQALVRSARAGNTPVISSRRERKTRGGGHGGAGRGSGREGRGRRPRGI